MKLKAKLFLSIGGIFFLFALSAFVLEAQLIRRYLHKTEQRLQQRLLQARKKEKEQLQTFIHTIFHRYEGQIDGALMQINLSASYGIWPYLTQLASQFQTLDLFSYTQKGTCYTLNLARPKIITYALSRTSKFITIDQTSYVMEAISPHISFHDLSLFDEGDQIFLLSKGEKGQGQKLTPIENKKGSYTNEKNRSYALRLASIVSHYLAKDTLPQAIAVKKNNNDKLLILWTASLFHQRQSNKKELSISSAFNISVTEDPAMLFLTKEKKEDGKSLIIGKSIGKLSRDLSVISNELVVTESKDTQVFTENGALVQGIHPKLSKGNMGSGSIKGEKVIFSKLTPFPHKEISFTFIISKKKAFQLIDFVHEQLKSVINRISWSIRALGLLAFGITLLFLHRLATKIARPITKLAHATKAVVDGHYDQADLPIREGDDEIALLVGSFSDMVEGLKEREHVRGTLNKVVSKEIAQKLLKDELHLGGVEKEGIILFADIRKFTELTEHMPPSEVITLLNECMTKISHVIDRHHGVIDKYVGDEVMALFNIPVADENSAVQALSCALEMQKTMKEWNSQRASSNKPSVEIGIGLHKGKVIAGNMGSENRLNYTVLGAHVNLAFRLCQAAKPGQILVSTHLAGDESLQKTFSFNETEKVSLKGFTEEIGVFEVTGKIG
jgi:class 3 adenylate cyclase